MIETREKVIDGATYTVTQLPARRALRLKAKLIKLFGPVLAQFFVTATDKGSDEDKKNDIVKAVEILGQHIDENSFEQLIVEMLNGVRKNGVELTPAVIDLEFAGDMAAIYHVVFFVMEVNFANFFSMVGIGSLTNSEPTQSAPDMKKTFGKR